MKVNDSGKNIKEKERGFDMIYENLAAVSSTGPLSTIQHSLKTAKRWSSSSPHLERILDKQGTRHRISQGGVIANLGYLPITWGLTDASSAPLINETKDTRMKQKRYNKNVLEPTPLACGGVPTPTSNQSRCVELQCLFRCHSQEDSFVSVALVESVQSAFVAPPKGLPKTRPLPSVQAPGRVVYNMDDLSCAVCSDVYEVRARDPVSLPKCGHTFCRPCLTSLQSQSLLFKCPSCRTQHTGAIIANLPPVYALLSILEKEKLDRGTLNMCKTHEDPIRLWCRPCYEELCGQCLFEHHMTEEHDVVKTEAAVDELKQKIEDQFEQLTLSIKEEKYQLIQELHDIAHQLGKLCRKSQKLENYSKRSEATLQTARASYQLKALVKNHRLLDEMMRDVSATPAGKEALPKDEARSPMPPATAAEKDDLQDSKDESQSVQETLPKDEVQAIEKIDSENEAIEVYDNDLDSNRDNDPQVVSETSKPTENLSSDIALWPLTSHAPGGKSDWPKINWYRFLMQVPAVQLLVPPENPQVYLKLSANGKDLGCLQIRLEYSSVASAKLLGLCLKLWSLLAKAQSLPT
ncbi:E3 ubiquitin-protein ligase TRIM50-like [Macrobrachium rosenbergii]|uniref:E3 ubiquitin-protein ligase TRIM50-like n=1 Tax=Macrobrachium rosenbergii TaxID=79674 RepID=UPI0034D53FBF